MPAFVPFMPATGVRRAGVDVVAALPDGPTLRWRSLVPDGAPTFELRAPTTAVARRITLATSLPELPAVVDVLRLSPLPFRTGPVLRRLPGLPEVWFGFGAGEPLPADDELVVGGDLLANPSSVVVAVRFADRVALSLDAWVELVAAAMTGIDSAADVAAWRGLARFAASDRSVTVLDHVGRPAAGRRFQVTSSAGMDSATTDATGTLPLPAGDLQLAWDAAQPVHALYEPSLADPAARATSTPPGVPLAVPAAIEHAHLQLLDAADWFADRPPQLDPGLAHVHPDSRMEPLVDGIATFAVMLDDLRNADGSQLGAHFAGWSFNDFPLDPSDPEGSMLLDVITGLREGGVDPAVGARFLMDQYFVFRTDAPTDAIERLLILLLTLTTDVVLVLSVLEKVRTDDRGYFALMLIGLLGGLALFDIGVDPVLEFLEEKFDGSADLAAAINAIVPGLALRSRHPATFADNAFEIVNPLPVDPSDFLDGVGSYHQKFQVIRRAPDALGNRVVGYVGGIDMNRNRLDTPGHHGRAWRPPEQLTTAPSPQAFHDVHARISGPAAADIALTFQRRWEFDVTRQPAGAPTHPLAFPTPSSTDTDEVPPQAARHLVQVGRSGYRPDPVGGGAPLPWSPAGEATIPQAIIRAIEQAREYIYIEDQYFTPPDPYISALLDASVREPELRLLIVIPTSSDQLFGNVRRREMFERLRDDPATGRGWGDRMIVGAPVRRPVLADAGRVASKGRLRLVEALGAAGGDVEVVLGPRARLPKDVPFWLWIQGEQMLAIERRDDLEVDGLPCRRHLVRRPNGMGPLWGARARAHDAGAPVTLSQVTGIYVHTKAIMVDDVFVGIGSCNTNRRGFYHDGEITAFAVPEQLKASPENPAAALRTALWAEHLGIPPAMGRALLADPIAAFELFRRPTLVGNRLSSLEALGVAPDLPYFPGEKATWLKILALLGLTVAEDLVPYAWNVAIEPTTRIDPDPRPGPALGTV